MSTPEQAELLYFADPMCSWCWGFVPVMQKIRQNFGAELPIRLFVGGLAVGVDKVLGDKAKSGIREHWEHVETDTGQGFDYGFFERDDFIYNSEQPSNAVVAVRNANLNSLYFLEALQSAFYQKNLDITSEAVLTKIAEEVGLDAQSFAAELTSAATLEDANKDYELTKKLGIQGFPTLLGMANNKIQLLTMGYQPYEAIAQKIEKWQNNIDTKDE